MNSYIPGKHCNLYYGEPIRNWDEAIPLGNGHSGCLLWGGSDVLRLSLDRGDLWDKRGAPEIYAEDFKYSRLIEFVEKKDFDSVNKKFDEFYFKPTPTKIPAGKILLKFGRATDKFEATLDIGNAVAETRLFFGESSTAVKVFVHAAKHVGYIEIKGGEAFPEVEIKTPGFGAMGNGDESCIESSEKGISSGSLKQLRYPSAVWGEQGELRWFTQKTAEELEYSIIVGQRTLGDKMEVVYTIAVNADSEGRWLEKAMELVRDTLADGFDKCCEEHGRWWRNFWSKSSISLPDKEFEKQWYLTNYLFGSCSRKGCYPMPLQGVWTADNDKLPPWKGDYHHDLNTQMSYWHYCKANHMEEGESFIDFLLETAEAGRKFAREFFDAPGLCLPSVMSIDGKALGGWPMYCLTLANQAWLCQSFVNHWLYSGDMEFLREKAYPYIKESALCIRRWLKPDAAGKLLLPLSSSPELHDNLPESWVTPNSNYDLSLLIYLFKSLKNMAEILGLAEADSWNEVLEALPELAVNEKNVLMISPDESLKESQRHLAHIMAIYPLKLMDYSSEREQKIIDASVVDLEILGTGLWVGFSFPWMAELYAVQGNGEGAAYQLKLFWENFCSSNGFHLNGDYKRRGLCSMHYRPFTLEGNMAAADALQEMLLYTDRGIIRAFPAVPDLWKKEGITFRSLRGEKGILISASLKEGKIEYMELRAEHAAKYDVENKFGENRLVVNRFDGVEQIECMEGSTFVIVLGEGEIINIKALGR